MAEGHRRRLVEKAITHGTDSFLPHEVLELYLFSVLPRVDTNPIAHALINRFGSLYHVCNAPVEELVKVGGIGQRAAEHLKLLPAMLKAYQLSMYDDKKVFASTSDLGDYCVGLFIGRVNEAMYLLCLDSKNKLIKQVLVAQGTPSEVHIEPRQVIEHVTHTPTCSVVLCHNHPGGTLMPSQQDIETTQRIKSALGTINIRLLDHIIVAKGKYISFNG